MIKHWVAKFKMGQTSSTDDQRVGRLIEVTSPEKIEKKPKFVVAGHRMEMSEIVETVCISTDCVAISYTNICVWQSCALDGAAFAGTWLKTVPKVSANCFSLYFQSNQIFTSIRNCWWDLGPRQHSWKQTMGRERRTNSKDGKGNSFCWRLFLGHTWSNLHWLL